MAYAPGTAGDNFGTTNNSTLRKLPSAPEALRDFVIPGSSSESFSSFVTTWWPLLAPVLVVVQISLSSLISRYDVPILSKLVNRAVSFKTSIRRGTIAMSFSALTLLLIEDASASYRPTSDQACGQYAWPHAELIIASWVGLPIVAGTAIAFRTYVKLLATEANGSLTDVCYWLPLKTAKTVPTRQVQATTSYLVVMVDGLLIASLLYHTRASVLSARGAALARGVGCAETIFREYSLTTLDVASWLCACGIVAAGILSFQGFSMLTGVPLLQHAIDAATHAIHAIGRAGWHVVNTALKACRLLSRWGHMAITAVSGRLCRVMMALGKWSVKGAFNVGCVVRRVVNMVLVKPAQWFMDALKRVGCYVGHGIAWLWRCSNRLGLLLGRVVQPVLVCVLRATVSTLRSACARLTSTVVHAVSRTATTTFHILNLVVTAATPVLRRAALVAIHAVHLLSRAAMVAVNAASRAVSRVIHTVGFIVIRPCYRLTTTLGRGLRRALAVLWWCVTTILTQITRAATQVLSLVVRVFRQVTTVLEVGTRAMATVGRGLLRTSTVIKRLIVQASMMIWRNVVVHIKAILEDPALPRFVYRHVYLPALAAIDEMQCQWGRILYVVEIHVIEPTRIAASFVLVCLRQLATFCLLFLADVALLAKECLRPLLLAATQWTLAVAFTLKFATAVGSIANAEDLSTSLWSNRSTFGALASYGAASFGCSSAALLLTGRAVTQKLSRIRGRGDGDWEAMRGLMVRIIQLGQHPGRTMETAGICLYADQPLNAALRVLLITLRYSFALLQAIGRLSLERVTAIGHRLHGRIKQVLHDVEVL
mmetsp:Transcript_48715/g.137064  ORF Transcript_48715/g.137064 Transcript_48715/m.137064 type:complete len:824 (-) Transcript_48715:1624-4095(-)